MENDDDIPTQRLLYLSNISQNTFFCKDAYLALSARDKVAACCTTYSPVYMRRRVPSFSRHVATRKAYLSSTPLMAFQEVPSVSANSNTCDPWRKSLMVVTLDSRIRDGCFGVAVTRQMLLKYYSLLALASRHFSSLTTPPPSSLLKPPTGQMHVFSLSNSNRPPLTLIRREPLLTFLIRRPVLGSPIPLRENDELFKALTKSIDLKAISLNNPTETFLFYETHFPLILKRNMIERELASTPSRRSRTPEPPTSVITSRQRSLNQRLVELEFMMEEMKSATEDSPLVTELYDATFDPTKWPWYKMDTRSFCRR
ncbi:uncharacterized protein LOC127853381 [Dreissena polymorpha]|uniref:Uncharacterized protein n=1 Tax=Dreissena polymorpha TaxID=45954 RepID=A0A9D4CHN6_DREPO|nr:uncharacterized protein LOC127853381 [Dreissena polymorpha]KAH3725490.1 hypothetical protein DPMN_051334 [Dreissena polymorpha]